MYIWASDMVVVQDPFYLKVKTSWITILDAKIEVDKVADVIQDMRKTKPGYWRTHMDIVVIVEKVHAAKIWFILFCTSFPPYCDMLD